MLTYDALIGQARIKGMPTDKIRGILREYLQVLTLKEIYKTDAGKTLYFTGGTYLRLAHGIKRFSEDLDFNTDSITKNDFENAIKKVKLELSRLNINPNIEFEHWKKIYSARLILPDIEKDYNVISRHSKKEGIVIKIETNRPGWKIKKESLIISGFGEIYPCISTDIGALFADKIDALDKKRRARHIYDIIFMLANKYPIDKAVLSSLGIKGDPLEAIIKTIGQFSDKELKKQAENLRPFLFEESEAGLIADARHIIPSLISKYRRLA